MGSRQKPGAFFFQYQDLRLTCIMGKADILGGATTHHLFKGFSHCNPF